MTLNSTTTKQFNIKYKSGGDKITIDVDTATATYDNPTDADWQRKSLTSALDESTCASESPCGFKATAEINVSALGDSAQVVVLQDDTDAPQDSTVKQQQHMANQILCSIMMEQQ